MNKNMIAEGATMGTTTYSHKEHAIAIVPFHSSFFESLHKEQWKEVRLGEVAEFGNGKARPKSLGNIPIYGGNGILGYTDKFNYEGETIIIGRVGAYCGCVYCENKQIWVSDNALIAKPKYDNSTKFLYYLLKHMNLNSHAEGSSQPLITQTLLNNLHVRICKNHETQNQIAEILSSFDDKIDLLHRQNKTLESLALTLFRHTFIDNPNRNEWEMGKLGDWIIETIGGDWGKEKPINDFQEKVSCIRGTDIADLNRGLADKTPIRYIKKNKLSILEPKEGDIIFEISGGTETQSTGRCIFVNQQVKTLFEYPIVFSNFCRLLRVKKKEYSYFLYLYLQYLYYNDEFFALENGPSGIKNLNHKALFYELEYKMPSEIQVIEFHEKVKIYFDKINANKKQIQNLQSMRDMLLAKILNEKMEV